MAETWTIDATCSCCGETGTYEMSESEMNTLEEYLDRGREMGFLQDLFPNVPAWIRAGAIDKYSGGFCVCPKCQGRR